jgi:hypothetical protein
VNDQLEKAVLDLKSIILGERCRLSVSREKIQPIILSFTGEN